MRSCLVEATQASNALLAEDRHALIHISTTVKENSGDFPTFRHNSVVKCGATLDVGLTFQCLVVLQYLMDHFDMTTMDC